MAKARSTAKKKTASKTSKATADSGPKFSLPGNLNSLLREVGVLVVMGFAVYLLVCLLSWSPNDPGPSSTGTGGEIQNWGGRVGAWFADAMFSLFGRMAYVLLLLCLALGWRVYKNRADRGPFNVYPLLLSVTGFFLSMTGACGLEQIYFPLRSGGDAFAAGGILGHYTANAFSANFGVVGATVILLALLTTGITLVSHVSWFNLMDRIGYQAFQLVDWGKEKWEEFADRKEGAKLRKEREVSVKEIREVITSKKSPKIEPKIEPTPEIEQPPKVKQASLFTEPGVGELPALGLLDVPTTSEGGYSTNELEAMSQLLIKKLKDFNVDITVEAVQPGPVITRFEIEPAAGVKASQIVGLAKDLARSLTVDSVRVVENIPGKNVIGIEIPNQNREIVRLVEGLASDDFNKSGSPLTMVLGKDIAGNAVVADLQKMPHVLIAGTTGSGKSVCINALILSFLYKATPDDIRMIMVDPKFLELSVYDGIPHLLAPVVTDMNKAANALRWCIVEMDRRFRVMADTSVRNIAGFNKKVEAANKAGEPLLDNTIEQDPDNPIYLTKLPYIVVIVDELADLMMVAGKKIEEIIIRIAQRARAAGIHLVLATQRPSVDVVTGLIKANVPTRIAFQVSSRADSRTVLDQMGAESLLGQGDMLFLPPGTAFTQRVHGSFVSDEEVAKVVTDLKSGPPPVYLDEVTDGSADAGGAGEPGNFSEGEGEADPLYDDAVRFVTQSRKASISSVQRALRVGYNRAARMIDTMEEAGVISSAENGKREVLAPAAPED
ncbi:MAG: DNA translocase FtsK 4TM domain-containing protein [Acidiferrobacterales bacterium]|nr:DNA translocase FtsK 4TM domain-containing protein [Acidiferrobacterales bacterium]